MSTKTMKKRSNQRGVAMIEAIVVITVLLVFLGMILWGARAYATKIDQAATTRMDVLYYASQNCEKGLSEADLAETGSTAASYASEDPDQPAATDGADPRSAEDLAGELSGTNSGAIASTGLKRDWNMASTSREQTVDGSTIVNLERAKLSTRVATKSWVACNEKNYGGDWNDLAQFVWGMKDNGAGLLGP